MNAATKKIILFSATLALIGITAAALAQIKTHRHLGNPGVKAVAVPGSVTMKIALPENVLDFTSSNVPTAQVVLDYLPKDTSFAQRQYFAPDGMWVQANMVLMGADRTSIHRPDFCLPGQGWQIVEKSDLNISITGATPYELPVKKWTVHNTFTAPDGQRQEVSGLYVFWFVTENNTTPDFPAMLKSMTYHLIRHGVLERWAYVSYFTLCPPGQEDATFARVKNLIAQSVPEFQLPPKK
jgi:hypothetical protein